MKEFLNFTISHLDEILHQTFEHIQLTVISVLLASAVGISLGITMNRYSKVAQPILGISGIIQTIPSLALLGFLLPFLGIGKTPAIVALFLYALLPVVRNTYVGIKGVDKAAKEAAIGMGMTRFQLLRYVEFPLAVPVILAGVRTSAVINIGVATLCAFIGAGGLGEMIMRGISLNNTYMILAGAIPASMLALLFDLLLGTTQKYPRQKLSLVTFPILLLITFMPEWALKSTTPGNSKLIAGFNSEFMEREDGYRGLDKLYGLPFTIREMEIGLMYKSLAGGEVDVIDGFSTDGRIKAYDLKLLDDDKGYFPPYNAAPIIRDTTLLKYPQLHSVFEQFNNLIDDKQMAELNFQVDFKKKELAAVAYNFLESQNIPAVKNAGHHAVPDIIIGSKAFTENYLLAYLFAQSIEGATNLKTSLKLGFGGTKLVFDALKTGAIDLYPEYTGTGFLVLLETPKSKRKALKTAPEIYNYVKERFLRTYKIHWMKPLGFNNTFALMMRKSHADSLKVFSISQLSDFLQEN